MNIERLIYLTDAVRNKTATKAEKDEWMLMLYNDGKISSTQYNKYLKDRNTDEILEATLAVVAIFLIGYLFLNLIGKK